MVSIYNFKIPVLWNGVLYCWVIISQHLEDRSAFVLRVKQSKKNSHMGQKSVLFRYVCSGWKG
jgi:hypothetical protein